jgi:hypothetical protein
LGQVDGRGGCNKVLYIVSGAKISKSRTYVFENIGLGIGQSIFKPEPAGSANSKKPNQHSVNSHQDGLLHDSVFNLDQSKLQDQRA